MENLMDLSDLARVSGNGGQPIAEITKGNSVAATSQMQQKEPSAAPSALLNQKQLEEILKVAEKTASDFNLNLRFEYREEANVFQVHVFDVDNQRVLRKIPSDEILRMAENVQKVLGMILDTKA